MFVDDVLDRFSIERGEASGGGNIAFTDFENVRHVLLLKSIGYKLFRLFEGNAFVDHIFKR